MKVCQEGGENTAPSALRDASGAMGSDDEGPSGQSADIKIRMAAEK